MLSNRNFIVVTGMSGAGKTTTMSVFEDMGYLTIDNFPHELLGDLAHLVDQDPTKYYNKVILGLNIMDFQKFLDSMADHSLDFKVIMLNCREDELLKRYKYNRRVHPLVKHHLAQTPIEAFGLERQEFNRLMKPEYIEIDTSFLSKRQLINEIELHREIEFDFNASISFQSFGYRFGIPIDADYIFDVRFLDNPYWNELLREKTGKDEEVINAVHADPKTERFLYALVALLDNVIDGSLNMDRSTLTIAIGCTGGQHRSVVIADYLKNHYGSTTFKSIITPDDETDLNVMVSHRDLERNLAAVKAEEKAKQN